MIFSSPTYAIFMAIVFGLYWSMRNSVKWQNALLLVASLVFYGWWDWRFLSLLLFCIFTAWAAAFCMYRTRYPKVVTGSAVTVQLGVLAVFMNGV